MKRGFLTAGTWCLDRNIIVDQWPKEDMSTSVRDIKIAGGGSACNFAVNIKKLDPAMPVETQGLIGSGESADFLQSVADDNGIDRRALARTTKNRTQSTDAFLSKKSGRRTHILTPGVASLLTPHHFDFKQSSARIVHFGLPSLHEQMDGSWQECENGWLYSLKQAKLAGLQTNLELVAGCEKVLRKIVLPCLSHLDTLIVNDFEIGALAEIKTISNDETIPEAIIEAAGKVLSLGSMNLVVVHFPRGAILIERNGRVISQPSVNIPPDKIVGTNGAGDAFAAGVLYGLHESWDLAECLKLGHAASAACLRSVETYTSVQNVKCCMALTEKWGWRSRP